jgi:uncharacterized protein YaaW (UPF0174 family)
MKMEANRQLLFLLGPILWPVALVWITAVAIFKIIVRETEVDE